MYAQWQLSCNQLLDVCLSAVHCLSMYEQERRIGKSYSEPEPLSAKRTLSQLLRRGGTVRGGRASGMPSSLTRGARSSQGWRTRWQRASQLLTSTCHSCSRSGPRCLLPHTDCEVTLHTFPKYIRTHDLPDDCRTIMPGR